MRETAVDGTPRSAKAAGAELRKLKQSFHERLQDPRFYDVAPEELEAVRVRVQVCAAGGRAGHMHTGATIVWESATSPAAACQLA